MANADPEMNLGNARIAKSATHECNLAKSEVTSSPCWKPEAALPAKMATGEPDYEFGGQEFESLLARHEINDLAGCRRLENRISLRFSLRKFLAHFGRRAKFAWCS